MFPIVNLVVFFFLLLKLFSKCTYYEAKIAFMLVILMVCLCICHRGQQWLFVTVNRLRVVHIIGALKVSPPLL